MMRRLLLVVTLFAIASVESFAPIRTPSLSGRLVEIRLATDPEEPRPTAPISTLTKDDEPSTAKDDIFSKLTAVANEKTADRMYNNLFEGEFGQRGEIYVVTQVVLVFCILGGGLPVLGGFLKILCGPVLMALGAGVILLGIAEMGGALSPWPVPTGDKLIKTGVFSKIRHPLYAGLIAFCAGLSIATSSAERLLLTTALLYALDLKSDYEEEQLVEEYADYEDYKKEVPGKFFPQELLNLLPWTKKE